MSVRKKVKSNLATEDLRQRRAELDQAFLSGYQRVAEQCRVVILLDTLELVQHENDVVQLLCGVEDHDALIKEWLIKQVASLPNTVVVFAGRPDSGSDAKLNPHSRSRVARDIRDAFLGNGQNYYEFMLGELSPKDSGAYIDNVVAGFPKSLFE